MSRITDQIDRILKKYSEEAFFAGGASEEEIKEAQQSLGCRFPEDYRHFLSVYGAGDFGGCEIYGIIPQKEVCQIPNGIWATHYLRQQYQMPGNYIAIAFDGYGKYYCIDTSVRNKENLCPIILWDMDGTEEDVPEQAADSFENFFLSWLKTEIDRMI